MIELPRRPRDSAEVLRAASAFLREAGREEARLEAEYLLAFVLKKERSQLLATDLDWSEDQRLQYEALLLRCSKGEPVAYLEGSRGFYAHEFEVSPAVLIPRADSECLVEAAIAFVGDQAAQIMDLGVGSGALLLSTLAACPHAHGLGVDRSSEALAVARRNAVRIGVADRSSWLQASWLDAVMAQSADVVLCNPPYIEPSEELGPGVAEHEPHLALFTSPGRPFECYEAVIRELQHCLRPHGRVYFEVGRARAAGVAERLTAAELSVVETIRDLGGVERVVVAAKN